MKKIFTIIVFFAIPSLLFAQKHDYIWQMGYGVELPQNPNSFVGFYLDFNNNKTIIRKNRRPIHIRENSATISDINGNLQFYTDGCKIINKNNQIMDNGDSLSTTSVYRNSSCQIGSTLPYGFSGSLILPPMNNDSTYLYLACYTDWTIGLPNAGAVLKINYSTIDMRRNNGLGKVIQKEIPLIQDTLDHNILRAVRHANGRDWWVVCRKYLTNTYYTIKVSPTGFDTIFTQSIGLAGTARGNGSGQILFTPDGRKLISQTSPDGVYIYDFDRQTGRMSNFQHFMARRDSQFFTGAAVSPNSRYLYLFLHLYIMQYDLQAADLLSSGINVADYIPDCPQFCPPFTTIFSSGMLAPDCKIYIASPSGLEAMSYIKYPDRRGAACEVVQRGVLFDIPTDSVAIRRGFPNMPNYRLGTPNPVCDSSILFRVSAEDLPTRSLDISDQAVLYPNPVANLLKVDLPDALGLEVQQIQISNLLGQVLVQEKRSDTYFPMQITAVSDLPEGVYHLMIQFKDNRRVVRRFVKL
jgi:hypothetical protein